MIYRLSRRLLSIRHIMIPEKEGSNDMIQTERVSELQDMVLAGKMTETERNKLTLEEKNIVDTCENMINGYMGGLKKLIIQYKHCEERRNGDGNS